MELENLLEKLKLDHLEHQLDGVCEQAAQRQLDYKAFLAQALQTEWQGRFQRNVEVVETGALPLDQDPGTIRVRLPAQPGSETGS